MNKAKLLSVGDRCRFASKFLRTTGQATGPDAPTSHGPWARGTVLTVKHFSGGVPVLVQVTWDNGAITAALATNLERCR